MGVEFEDRELRILGEDLANAAAKSPEETRKVVAKGLLNIKNDARQRAQSIEHVPSLPGSITYDSHPTPTGAWGEVGPEQQRRGGNLAGFIENEYGTVWSAPQPFMAPAARAEEPKFARAMEDLAVRLAEGDR
ncbi:hypothetical protein Ait01nite_032170 [Actinoplanes italicus]|uniref:HK97 gp10 family phage protein n=1 Tax=Actinoplanes italicus TaxID=113567 RepID=A0A2T0KJG2_9ACTN|nr:hypothetical protein [Actinoplanes italicus]PRX23670.1 hypothetical protein CLV67_103419 [Actinoplanes italicus]GIE30172.1 hypothetical protein Ait01nite_032170 [Actinoplanes italicus]